MARKHADRLPALLFLSAQTLNELVANGRVVLSGFDDRVVLVNRETLVRYCLLQRVVGFGDDPILLIGRRLCELLLIALVEIVDARHRGSGLVKLLIGDSGSRRLILRV